MNENMKTITAEQFAPILEDTLRRFGARAPWENSCSNEDLNLVPLNKTLKIKISKDINITNKSILTENLINQVIEKYDEKAKSYYTSPNWYNILRRNAWKAAAQLAFHREELQELPKPEYIPACVLENEFAVLCGNVNYRTSRQSFEALMGACGLQDEIKLTSQNVVCLLNAAHDKYEKEQLNELYEFHFGRVLLPETKPEVVEVKDLDKTIVEQLDTSKEVKLVMDDYMHCYSTVVQGIITQLEGLGKAKAVSFDDAEKEQILTAIGCKGLIEEVMQAKKRIEELTEEVVALSSMNDNLEKQLKQSKNVRQKLMDILGETAA